MKFFNTTRIFLQVLGIIRTNDGSVLVLRVICLAMLLVYIIIGAITYFVSPDHKNPFTFGVSVLTVITGSNNFVKVLWYIYNTEKVGWLVDELERITIENFSNEKLQRKEFIEASKYTTFFSIFVVLMMVSVFVLETLNCLFFTTIEDRVMFGLYSFIDPTRYYFWAMMFQYMYYFWTIAASLINLNLILAFTLLTVVNLAVLDNYLRLAPARINLSVSLHAKIIRFDRVLNEVLQPSLITELAMSTLLTCICAFLCAKSTGQHRNMAFGMIAIEAVIPWIICYCGSLLEEKSNKLTDAVYDSRWPDIKPKQRKEIMILMLATRRPLQYKLSWTHIVNFAYYSSFIQMSYSFFTLLLSLDS